MPLRAGDWIEVRSKEEILATLDTQGQLEGLHFMPEMLEFCGRRFRVFKRAHKTCDPPNGLQGRRMLGAVHLESVRCNGAAHGGCQAACLIFWKEAWLRKVESTNGKELDQRLPERGTNPGTKSGCTEEVVAAGTQASAVPGNPGEPVYVCQSTHLAQATLPLRWWDLRQYLEDHASGNVRLAQLAAAFCFFLYSQVVSAGIGLGSALRWIYDVFQRVRGGTPYPHRFGKIRMGDRTPTGRLDLQKGELVRIRSYPEILETLNEDFHNRGLYFDSELVPYCGGTYRVLDRIAKIIDEKTGKMRHMKNDCITLEDVICRACYTTYRRFCPRSFYPYWRELWLERVGGSAGCANEPPPGTPQS